MPLLEPVPRYRASPHALDDLVDLPSDNPIEPLSREARRAFVELSLSGLFPGHVVPGPDLKRKSVFNPYDHQMQMLARGIVAGRPGIVTSGTGSGKTEAFMLPILAALAAEAVDWPAPATGYLAGRWWESDPERFRLHRAGENDGRPKAVRALVLYPMNALVEDQLTRLRRTLDSNEARAVMRDRFAGNQIFFGRYTGATPVTGYLRHPRRASDRQEQKRRARRIATLAESMTSMERDQDTARTFDRQEAEAARRAGTQSPDPTRFLFPATDGGELLSRWDIQQTPPDVLVTNVSMLGTMLSREVEAPIFETTRRWLEENDDAYFFLVLDELHLVRGSAGTEVSGLVRALLHRLGLDRKEHSHKLRVLASSASLPLEGRDGDRSSRYLYDFFGPFGTFTGPRSSGASAAEFWRSCIVTGTPLHPDLMGPAQLEPLPFRYLADILTNGGRTLGRATGRTRELDEAVQGVYTALCPRGGAQGIAAMAKLAVEAAAAVLAHSCRTDEHPAHIRATAIDALSARVFGSTEATNVDALRGLILLRGLGDHLKELYGLAPDVGTTSFRAHLFLRSIEGLFATLREASDGIFFDGTTIERGTT